MRFQDVAVWSAIATTEVFGAAIANPMITPAPVIFPRQASSADSARSGTEKSGTANPNFIGYYMSLDGGRE
jgi:hypothetical protein